VKALALAFALALPAAFAEEPAFPQRGPVEITVLFPAGSSADVTARLLAEGMAKRLDQNVLVFNRPGAGGAIGYKYVAGQKADG
jgi:tripartite-type tricarboxylate transporter receptor subunit TctC